MDHSAPQKQNRDYLTILSGTSQNVVGIVIAAIATFGAQILMTRTLGATLFGVVTAMTQAAFVISFATRAGMDMAVLRDVAIRVGEGTTDKIRAPVARGIQVAVAVSVVVAVIAVLLSGAVKDVFSVHGPAAHLVVPAAAIGLPFLAATNVWLSATRGLKIMRYTLYVFFAGQPVLWLAFMLIGWTVSETAWMSVLAYSASWVVATGAAWFFWRRESAPWEAAPMETGEMGRLMRYAGPRAPAALFSQLLFWTDLFVVRHYVSGAAAGVYSAALRAGQVVVLFLTSVNLMFSPFVADLHNRGETKRLDELFKTVTRWTLAATLPAFLVLAIVPSSVLKIFGGAFASGQSALLILLAGQLINIATGSVGFVLIMAGRTGWDLVVYAGALVLDITVAFVLSPHLGIEGAATANAITFTVSNATRLVLVKRFVGIQPYDRRYGRIVAPATAAALAMLGVKAVVDNGWLVQLAAVTVVGLAVYGASYLAVGLTEQERRGAKRLLERLKASRGQAKMST